jgi:thioredoxin-related protein
MKTDRWGGQRTATLRAAILACAFALSAAAQAAGGIRLASDFFADGREARETQRVIVVLFTTAGCPWCQRVREEHLNPMLANPGDVARIIVREIDIDGRDALTDFSGAITTHAAFAGRHAVRFAPTVLILGPRGEQLAAPLVGFGTADYYGYYLGERIDTGLAKVRR